MEQVEVGGLKNMRIILLVMVAMLNSKGEDLALPLFGPIPRVDANWGLLEKGTNYSNRHSFSWLILTNRKSGDLLSFAAEAYGTNEFAEVNRVPWSDLVADRFPGGEPGWKGEGAQKYIGHWIRNEVRTIRIIDSRTRKSMEKGVLEYTLVFEKANREGANRLAHGYAVPLGNLRLMVQHTSTQAITPELSESLVTEMAQGALDKMTRENKPRRPAELK